MEKFSAYVDVQCILRTPTPMAGGLVPFGPLSLAVISPAPHQTPDFNLCYPHNLNHGHTPSR